MVKQYLNIQFSFLLNKWNLSKNVTLGAEIAIFPFNFFRYFLILDGILASFILSMGSGKQIAWLTSLSWMNFTNEIPTIVSASRSSAHTILVGTTPFDNKLVGSVTGKRLTNNWVTVPWQSLDQDILNWRGMIKTPAYTFLHGLCREL